MDSHVYIHGIYPTVNYNSLITLHVLSKILKSGSLLSLRLQNRPSRYGFNGIDYISFCDYDKRFEFNLNAKMKYENCDVYGYNAFNYYIRYSLSLIFPKDMINALATTLIDIPITTRDDFLKMKMLGESENKRYSDMPDEVQVKDSVSIDKMSGVAFPIHQLYLDNLSIERNTKNIVKELRRVKCLLEKYRVSDNIYDIDTFLEVKDYDDVKKLVKMQKENTFR